MKNLLKLPVLLLAVMLVVSCGDSKKEDADGKKTDSNDSAMTSVQMAEADGKKMGELECAYKAASSEDDFETMAKLEEEATKMREEMEKKWADYEQDSDEAKAAEAAYAKAVENCG